MNKPDFLEKYIHAPAMQRLKHVDMSCGMNYTHLPYYRKGKHNRFDHSLHTAQITWQYSKDQKASLAALFHDISTPAFAHTVDFLNGDALRQESTEKSIALVLENDPVIAGLLRLDGIRIEEVSNPHVYPILDSPAPDLCADRLAYLWDDILYYEFGSEKELQQTSSDITVDQDRSILCFTHLEPAKKFADMAFPCFVLYSSADNRYGMEMLARLLREAVNRNILRIADLYEKEEEQIICILQDSSLREEWAQICSLQGTCLDRNNGIILNVKKRYIDPWILNVGKRLSEADPTYQSKLKQYLQEDFTKEKLKGIYG